MSTVGLGILSWRANETLRKMLESIPQELLDCFQDKVIYFSDIDESDRKIAAEFGFRAEGGPNEGIGYGMMHVIDAIDADYVAVLQNDCPVIIPANEAVAEIKAALDLLENKVADIVRLRHRWLGGEIFWYQKQYLKLYSTKACDCNFRHDLHNLTPRDHKDSFAKKIRRTFGYAKAKRLRGKSVFIEQSPHLIHGDVIKKAGEFYIIDSSALRFSDQPFMIRKSFFMDVIWPYVLGHPVINRNKKLGLEESLCTSWWRKQHFKIAQGTGVFTHKRYDRPYEQGMERLLCGPGVGRVGD